MVAFPPCKINLGLNILRRRTDGFHDLQTCFYPVPWCDILEVIPAEEFRFTSSGLRIDGEPEKNLCVQAYQLLRADRSIPPVHIHLHKIIPMGAGLGGGSSDAAHTLLLLNEIFALGLTKNDLMRYATQLGSDCAFFIEAKAMIGTGRGEVLAPIDLSLGMYHIVIIKPDVSVSTAEAYAGIKPKEISGSLRTILETVSIDKWKEFVVNDFEESVFKKYPQLSVIKQTLYKQGAVYAAMSGSGSAVFGVFNSVVNIPGTGNEKIIWTKGR